jgi:hypothetical protein
MLAAAGALVLPSTNDIRDIRAATVSERFLMSDLQPEAGRARRNCSLTVAARMCFAAPILLVGDL